MSKPLMAIVAAVAATALVAAGCGGGSDSSSGGIYGESSTPASGAYGGASTATETTAAAEGGSAATVSVAAVPKLGRVLVDSKGLTLYDFHKDKSTKSACYGGCAKVWPPLVTTGKPQPSNGASASKLGTTQRSDGTLQVTYAGHPLYTYTADVKPGDAKGHDFSSFGAQWYALTPQGTEPGD